MTSELTGKSFFSLSGCRKFYEQVSHTHDERLPFGIAATGACVDPGVSKETVLGMPRYSFLLQHIYRNIFWKYVKIQL